MEQQPIQITPIEPIETHAVNGGDEIRTIFLTGLSDDVTPRELHLMFLRDQDYEGCVLKQMGRQMVAFVSFKTHAHALNAIAGVQGLKFDPTNDRPIRAELAKANSKIKRQRVGGTGPPSMGPNPHKRPFDASPMEYGGAQFGMPMHDAYYGVPQPQPSMWPSGPMAGGPMAQQSPGMMYGGSYAADGYPKGSRSGGATNPPCNTLFVVNFGLATTEADLAAVFQQYTGYQRMKLTQKGTCFVEFSDIESASACRDAVQGTVLPTCDRGGLRIEFAKTSMGTRPNQ